MSEVQTKMCKACSEEKTAGDFHKSSSKKDGLQVYCKVCAAEMRRHQKAGTYVSRLRDNEIIIDGEIGRVPVKTKDGIKFAIIDACFAVHVSKYRWCLSSNFYPHAQLGGQKIMLHRYVMILSGQLIDGLQIDHISRDIMDSRIANLRATNNAVNSRNSGRRTGNYRGVCWQGQAKKWLARIKIDGKEMYLGLFTIESIAARAYDWAVITLLPADLHAGTNFPRSDYEGFSSREEMLAHYTQLWEDEQTALEQSNEDDPFCAGPDDEDDGI